MTDPQGSGIVVPELGPTQEYAEYLDGFFSAATVEDVHKVVVGVGALGLHQHGITSLSDFNSHPWLRDKFRRELNHLEEIALSECEHLHSMVIDAVRNDAVAKPVPWIEKENSLIQIESELDKARFLLRQGFITERIREKLWGKPDLNLVRRTKKRDVIPKDPATTLFFLQEYFKRGEDDSLFAGNQFATIPVSLLGYQYPEALQSTFSKDQPGQIPLYSLFGIKSRENTKRKVVREAFEEIPRMREEVRAGRGSYSPEEREQIRKHIPKYWPVRARRQLLDRTHINDVMRISLVYPGGHDGSDEGALWRAVSAISRDRNIRASYGVEQPVQDDYQNPHALQRIKMRLTPKDGYPGRAEIVLVGLPEYVALDVLTRPEYLRNRDEVKHTRKGESLPATPEQRRAAQDIANFTL